MYEVLMRLFNSVSHNEYDNTENRLGPCSNRRFLSNFIKEGQINTFITIMYEYSLGRVSLPAERAVVTNEQN